MRSKNLFVANVDVYSIGVYISSETEKTVHEKSSKAEYKSISSPSTGTSLSIVLRFVRDVGTDKVVDALVQTLTGKGGNSYDNQLALFKDILVSALGKSGIKKDEEIVFVWKGVGGEDLAIEVRGKLQGSVKGSELRDQLAAVYVGSQAVAPEVVKNLDSYFGH